MRASTKVKMKLATDISLQVCDMQVCAQQQQQPDNQIAGVAWNMNRQNGFVQHDMAVECERQVCMA